MGLVSGGKPTNPGNSPVSISNPSAGSVTPTGASVSWQTNVPANSQVEYGISPNYGSTTALDSKMVTSHLETLANLKGGTVYHYRVHSADANNDAAVSADMTLTTPSSPDTTTPTVSITSPQSGAALSANVNVMITAADNVGVAGVQLKVDSANSGAEATAAPYVVALDTRSLSNGNHILSAVARDAAGNTATSASVPVKVNNTTPDTTPPTVAISLPAAGATVSGTITVSANATDNVAVASVQFKLDGNNLGALDLTAPYSVTLNTTTASNGSHTLTALATDSSNNTATSAAVTFTVKNTTPDTTPPVVSITAPVSGATVSGTITINANATDNVAVASVQFKLDGGNLGAAITSAPYNYSLNTTTLSNGSHTLTAVATDTSGNTATSAAVTISVNNALDTTPPTVSITSPASGGTVSGTISVSANASDNVGVASVQFQVDGANAGFKVTAAPYTTSLNTAALTNGNHTLTAVARDAAGNTGTSAPITVNVNNTGGPGLPQGLGWFDMPNTKLQSVCPPVGDNQPSSSASYNFPFYCQYVVRDWSGGIADTKRNRLILWGGGHSAYYGNELYSFDLNTLQLTRLNDPSPIADGTSCPQALSDGKPNARHTYAGLAYIAHADKMFVYSGGLANTDGCNSNDTWTLDLATLQWQRVNPAGGVTPFPQGLAGPSVAYDPTSKLVYVQDREAFWSYSYDTNTYTQLNHTGSSLHINSVVDPKRRLFLTLGGPNDTNNGPSLLAISIASGSNYALQDWTSSVTGCAALMASASPGLVYDPVLDRIVGWPDFGNTVYLFDPDTKSCTTQTFAGGPPDSAHEAAAPDSTGTYGRFQYFPAFGVYALVNDWNIDVHVLRLTNGSGANPSPTITVSGVASSNITTSSAVINWTTSVLGSSQVEYGTTTSYGQKTSLLSSLLIAHQQTLTNLTPNTLYHYRVHSLDLTSNEAVSADFALVTSSGGDVTPPTVSVSSPASGSTVSGTVTVAASASDNVGVSWVQFYLDGAGLGGQATSAPYSTAWSTASAANGSHTLTAVASDAAGNTATSSPVAVTVSNSTSGGGSAAADFQARCQAAGVIRCIGFDSAADIANKVDDSSGYLVNITGNGTAATATIQGGSNGHIVGEDVVIRLCTSVTAFNNTGNSVYKVTAVNGNTFSFASSVTGSDSSGNCVVRNVPEIDTTMSASGGGSLKMTVPAFTSANSSGEFHTFFLDDKSAQFGSSADPKCQPGTLVAPCAGSEFYVQYRFRVNDVMLNTVFSKSNGWKMSIINDPGTNSCTAIHIVTEDSNMTGYPQMYHSCGGKDNHYESLETFIPATSDYFDQNAALSAPNAACFHYSGRGTPPGVRSCFTYTANEWMTFQYHVKVGTWYVNNSGNYHRDSTVEMWVAHEGKPSELVLSFNDYDLANVSPTDPTYPLRYGQVWLLPYQTNKDATQAHATGYVWYDELIISKNRIPDPAVTVPNAPDALRATAVSSSQVNLTWRDNSGGSAGFKIERCQGTDDVCWAGYAPFNLVTTVGAGAASHSDTGLTSATAYTYRVRATNSAGDSASSGGSCWNSVSANGSSCYGTAKTK